MSAVDLLLRKRLAELLEKTSMPVEQVDGMDDRLEMAMLAEPGFSGERAGDVDVADLRRVRDDNAAGRLHLRNAHHEALDGLHVLEKGDVEMARFCAWQAT